MARRRVRRRGLGRALGVLLVLPIVGAPACSVLFETKCYDGTCEDKSYASPAASGADVTTAPPDAPDDARPTDGGPDALDAADTAPDPCAISDPSMDPCRTVPHDAGGCFCADSTQVLFDTARAKKNCLYRCDDHTAGPTYTHGKKYCAAGCTIETDMHVDHCSDDHSMPTFETCL